jgi:RimJ/RimL family protein N-acetyltransferase
MEWMPWAHPGYSLDESKKWLKTCAENWKLGSAYEFVITDSGDGAFLGGCGLNRVNAADRYANLGYWVRTSRAGQGIATQAIGLLAPFGFGELRLNRIEILAATGNLRSQRVAAKSGALKEGILRNRLFLNGRPHDAVIFSLAPDGANESKA